MLKLRPWQKSIIFIYRNNIQVYSRPDRKYICLCIFISKNHSLKLSTLGLRSLAYLYTQDCILAQYFSENAIKKTYKYLYSKRIKLHFWRQCDHRQSGRLCCMYDHDSETVSNSKICIFHFWYFVKPSVTRRDCWESKPVTRGKPSH